MCGIAGFTRFGSPFGDESLLHAMGDTMIHRGPDASGTYIDSRIGLCHRRLSIIDLSESGNQPMASTGGGLQIVFNGEIYNFQEYRKQALAEGYVFRSESDTEVILYLYHRYGLEFVQHLNGMFAIALWDAGRQRLVLARDRLGKKPLYYTLHNNQWLFASELKALLAVPGFNPSLRRDAVADFFFYQYVPDPKTVFRDVHKLAPGHMLVVTPEKHTLTRYWRIQYQTQECSEEQAVEELRHLIADSVRMRMISDVPLGAFLSGGVDSSVVVANMATLNENTITCSIGFEDKHFDEVSFARQIADQYATSHTEFVVGYDLPQMVGEISRYFDEPFADPSYVPTYFVSQLARRKVTVALAGDGGDECFAGYSKYKIDRLENRLRQWSRPVLTPFFATSLARLFKSLLPPTGGKLGTLLRTLSVNPAEGFFLSNAFFRQPLWDDLVDPEFDKSLAGYHPRDVTLNHYTDADSEDHLGRIQYVDQMTYLPGDILVKVDRMSMAHSLETRAPLLDYRLVEFAAKLPSRYKLSDHEGKHILKKAYEGELSNHILYRKKMGFSVPLRDWMRDDLSSLFERVVLRPDAGVSQIMQPGKLRRVWQAHRDGKANCSAELWSILNYELWWSRYVAGQMLEDSFDGGRTSLGAKAG